MNKELISIETAEKLAKYQKMKEGIEEIKSFIISEIEYCKYLSDDGAFDCCIEELVNVKNMLEKINKEEKC